MPVGKVKWFDANKGFGFLAADDGQEAFVGSSALPQGTVLQQNQRVEFDIVEGRRGPQAMQVRTLDAPPSIARAKRKDPDEMAIVVEDLIKVLDASAESLKHGRYPDRSTASNIAQLLRAVADEFDA